MTVWISNIKSKENMKRIFNALGLMLAATLTLTNCTKNIETPVVESEGVPFEIVASTVETKTVNDGMSTLWAAGDKINLFHAVAGTTTYSNDNNFTVNNVETGLFKGTLTGTLAEDSAYDWYAFYPYASQMTTPANTSAYAYIGNKNGLTQNRYDNMAHVSGTNCPLYGVAKAVPSGEMPSLQMHHLSSVIAVKVTNTLETPLKVNEVIFTADGNELTGSFYINIAGDEVDYKPSTGYVSTEAKVTVSNATELAKGESATVYLVVKPFEAYEGDMLEIFVNGYRKELYLEKDVDFEAGKIKTLNFAYDSTEEPEGPEVLTVAEFCAKPDGSTIYEVTGTITGIYQAYNSSYNNISYYIKDATGEMVVYRMSCVGVTNPATTITPGDLITVQGTKTTYNGVAQMAQGGKYISHIDASDAPAISCEDNVVTITAETGAVIYYTTNGDVPTTESSVYSEPFTITESCTVSAIAVAEGKVQSVVTTASCTYWDPNQEQPEDASYTLKFGSNYNSKSVSSYTDTWYVTYEGFKCEMKNWNNNQNKWNYVKAGRKNTASVATITTTASIPEAMTKVTLTIDAVTASKINSLKLYVASGNDFSGADVYSASVKTGEVVFTITSPANNKYYKIEVDCASGSSNGLLTLSKVVYSNF